MFQSYITMNNQKETHIILIKSVLCSYLAHWRTTSVFVWSPKSEGQFCKVMQKSKFALGKYRLYSEADI